MKPTHISLYLANQVDPRPRLGQRCLRQKSSKYRIVYNTLFRVLTGHYLLRRGQPCKSTATGRSGHILLRLLARQYLRTNVECFEQVTLNENVRRSIMDSAPEPLGCDQCLLISLITLAHRKHPPRPVDHRTLLAQRISYVFPDYSSMKF